MLKALVLISLLIGIMSGIIIVLGIKTIKNIINAHDTELKKYDDERKQTGGDY